MTQPQQQKYTPGARVDVSREETRDRLIEASVVVGTVTLGGVYADGVYSYTFTGPGTGGPLTISYTATAGDDLVTVTTNLNIAFGQTSGALRVAETSAAAQAQTLRARNTEDVPFSLGAPTAPGGATLAVVVPPVSNPPLDCGTGVVLKAGTKGDSIRAPEAGDTKMFGVLVKGPGIASNDGDATANDRYDAGVRATCIRKGLVPVFYEDDPTLLVTETDTVHMSVQTTGNHVAGHFTKTADGANTIEITNAEFAIGGAWVDQQGRTVAMIELNRPG